MNPYKSNLLNSITLIVFGLWGGSAFLFSCAAEGSMTSLIPCIFGIILLALSPTLKKENKVIAHIVVLLTIVIFLSLFMPLNGAIDRSDSIAIMRVSAMIFTSLIALYTFIKSFIDARKQKS
ncbi:MAG: hypothetical protein CMP50_05520 [Flavobacteriales bacterium]|nr:hypothetical protein [Flavobacteriales bacterium]